MQIMFVDDEPRILDGLRRMLRSMRDQWDTTFANNGAEVLGALAEKHFDVIVSDIRMPGMSGVELLENVRQQYPYVIRLALSGQAATQTVINSAKPTHQYLSKPCNAETLKSTLGRLKKLRELLSDEKLRGAITSVESLPSPASLHDELTAKLLSPDVSISSVRRTISNDIAMSAKILQLVSSGFFGAPRHVSDPAEAVAILGLEIIKPLVLSLGIFSQFDKSGFNVFSLENLHRHSFTVANCARKIAELEGMEKEDTDRAYIAGLLHDIGKLILAGHLGEKYDSILAQTNPLEAEKENLNATHAQVGAYLLGIWGLSDPVVDAVTYHHNPRDGSDADRLTPLMAVHVANALELEELLIDREYIDGLGLSGRMDIWKSACDEIIHMEKVNV